MSIAVVDDIAISEKELLDRIDATYEKNKKNGMNGANYGLEQVLRIVHEMVREREKR